MIASALIKFHIKNGKIFIKLAFRVNEQKEEKK